jgi:hypothetical protein
LFSNDRHESVAYGDLIREDTDEISAEVDVVNVEKNTFAI